MDCFFFVNDTATTEIYTLSLPDALPISARRCSAALKPGADAAGTDNRPTPESGPSAPCGKRPSGPASSCGSRARRSRRPRSEEHTSELQSRQYLVCRLLLEKKKKILLQQ